MKYIQREIESDVLKWLDKKEVIAIRGTRQCGKTTLLKRIIEILIERKIPKDKIHFISFEDDSEKEKFEKNPRDYVNYYLNNDKSKHFFLFDEVQYVKNAGKILKLIYDEIENVKIIITGSSTLDLNEVGSFLVGRVLLFEMYPFSFSEFLECKNTNLYNHYLEHRIGFNDKKLLLKESIYLNELNENLKEYLTFGGYPAIVLENNKENKKVLLKNLFQTYIEKDIVKVYGSRYKQRISELIKYLSGINTSILNYNDIASITGLYDKEVKQILSILEETYVIKLVRPFYKNLITELKKNPKIYFIDVGLRNFITGRFEFGDEEYGKLLENYVYLAIKGNKVNYWRTTAKAEVDFVINEKIPIESKINAKITRSFGSFLDTYKPDKGFMINLKDTKKVKVNKTDVYFVPFSLI